MPIVRSKDLVLCILAVCCLSGCTSTPLSQASAVPPATPSVSPDWVKQFDLQARELSSTGEARYFILKPGFQAVLASKTATLTISVLNETRQLGGIETRVVEEREEVNGALSEISRNYFAIDNATGDAFYFGEEVDLYSLGQISGHGGAWLAFENGNQPGLIMPGTPAVGMKYYQELAPGVAEDRARVVSISESISTRAGNFANCLLTQESSNIEPGAVEYKTYCPGVGLVQDEDMTLASVRNAGETAP